MLAIAHLSDIHISSPLDLILNRAEQIAAAIGGEASDCHAVVMAITGDIAFSGKQDQYQLAIPFFREIHDRLTNDYNLCVKIVACPGNHDCDFSLDQEFRDMALAKIEGGVNPSERLIDECTSVQRAYFEFLKELCNIDMASPSERLRYKVDLSADGELIIFDCLNLSWVSKRREDRVSFPASIIPKQKSCDGLNVSIMHHPFNWLSQACYHEFRKNIRSSADIILTGHEHSWLVVETADSASGGCLQIEGGVLQDAKYPESSVFSVIKVDIKNRKYKSQRFEWDKDIYCKAHSDEWSNYRAMNIKDSDSAWRFSDEHDLCLDDPGHALRTGSGRSISLRDIYIFPDLEPSTPEGDESAKIESTYALINDKSNAGGYLIVGEELSGKTALLCQLARTYLESGMVPLFLSGSDLTRASEADINALLTKEVAGQYGKRFIPRFEQIPPSKRVILIDDIDDIPIRSESAREDLIKRLISRCGSFIATASEVFESSQIVVKSYSASLSLLPTYRILPFGHLARTRLVNRWVSLNANDGHSEDDKISLIDNAEKCISAVLSKGGVPAHPIYLITLLHSESYHENGSFNDGDFGNYYEYIITQGILASGVLKDKVGDIYSYCTQLAWHMSEQGVTKISSAEFKNFNSYYSKCWMTVEHSGRKRSLIDARLIVISGDYISFKYPYLYSYFVARYLSDNIDSDACWKYVEDSAKHLYVRQRANTLVFLTHFTSSPRVIDAILETLRAQFQHQPIIKFNQKNRSVEFVLSELPKAAFFEGDPLLNREDESMRKDRVRADDGLMDVHEDSVELSLPAKLASVFKGVEIVGQILTVRYAKFQRPRKREMISEVINGPLRALEEFYELLMFDPTSVIAEVKRAVENASKLMDDAELEALARRVVGMIVLSVSFSYIQRIADAISAQSIRDDLIDVIECSDDISHRLVGLACTLDGQRPLPRAEIEHLLRIGDGSLIVEKLVQLLTIYRMHMFRTSASDIQWASTTLNIPTHIRIRSLLSASSRGGERLRDDAGRKKDA